MKRLVEQKVQKIRDEKEELLKKAAELREKKAAYERRFGGAF